MATDLKRKQEQHEAIALLLADIALNSDLKRMTFEVVPNAEAEPERCFDLLNAVRRAAVINMTLEPNGLAIPVSYLKAMQCKSPEFTDGNVINLWLKANGVITHVLGLPDHLLIKGDRPCWMFFHTETLVPDSCLLIVFPPSN